MHNFRPIAQSLARGPSRHSVLQTEYMLESSRTHDHSIGYDLGSEIDETALSARFATRGLSQLFTTRPSSGLEITWLGI